MNLSRYIIAVFVAQAVRCNTIGGKWPPRFPQSSRTGPDVEDTDIGVKIKGDKLDFASKENALISYDLTQYPTNDAVMSAHLYHSIMTSRKAGMTSQVRIRRSSEEIRKKKGKCDPGDKVCKKNRRKNRKGKKSRKGKGKKKGRKRQKGKRKIKKIKNTDKIQPPITKMVPGPAVPRNANNTFIDLNSGFTQKCVRTSECPEGYCCARHHWEKVCKPMLKLNDICVRTPPKHRKRNTEYFELCACEVGLTCARKQTTTRDGKKSRSRLYSCQQSVAT